MAQDRLVIPSVADGVPFRQLRVGVLARFPGGFGIRLKSPCQPFSRFSVKPRLDDGEEQRKNKGTRDITAGSDLEEAERRSGKTDR